MRRYSIPISDVNAFCHFDTAILSCYLKYAVSDWLAENSKGSWLFSHTDHGYFLDFENENDYLFFVLRWG